MATKTSFAELQRRIQEAERKLTEDRQLAESMREEELKAFVEEWLVWCADLFCTYRPTSQSGFGAGHFGEDVVGTRCPNERLWVVVVMLDVLGDGLLKIVHGCEAVAPDPVLGDVTKEPLDHVQPGGAGGREVHDEARMLCQPRANLRMLMRRVVVDDQVQDHLLGRLAIDEPKETEPFRGDGCPGTSR